MDALPIVKKEDMHIGCATCSTVSQVVSLDMPICVGFGCAYVTKDDSLVYDGEAAWRRDEEVKTLAKIELIAADDPTADWRLVMHGPLHGETYQRQLVTKEMKFGLLPDNYLSADKRYAWVMVDSNQGFA